MTKRFLFTLGISLYCAAVASEPAKTISESQLLAYATAEYDRNAISRPRVALGRLGGTPVVADFICSDICPDYTVRVIHFELGAGQTCSAVGGIEKAILVPVSIAATEKVFCFPAVIAKNWESYIK